MVDAPYLALHKQFNVISPHINVHKMYTFIRFNKQYLNLHLNLMWSGRYRNWPISKKFGSFSLLTSFVPVHLTKILRIQEWTIDITLLSTNANGNA
jgi:hypothetical protein